MEETSWSSLVQRTAFHEAEVPTSGRLALPGPLPALCVCVLCMRVVGVCTCMRLCVCAREREKEGLQWNDTPKLRTPL